MTSRDPSSHMPLIDAHPRAMRNDAPGGSGGLLIGYDAGAGDLRSFPGDDKFPFVMQPPDLGTTASYARFTPANNNIAGWGNFPTLTTDILVPYASPTQLRRLTRGGTIDVRGIRQLTFYMTLQINLHTSNPGLLNALVLVPQVANAAVAPDNVARVPPDTSSPYVNRDEHDRPNMRWFGLPAMDPTLRGMFPTGASPLAAFCAPLYALQNVYMQQLNFPLNPDSLTTISVALPFDVSTFEYFRLCYALQTQPPVTGAAYPAATTDATYDGDYFQLDFQAMR